MFTWNFKYISKARLAETLNQIQLNNQKSDILIRIHTAIHIEEEAVDLAKFIKSIVPKAHIFGTSTSAPVFQGKFAPNQCVISVTLMNDAKVKVVVIPVVDSKTKEPLPADTLCKIVEENVIEKNTKLLLTFMTDKYNDVYSFVEKSNDYYPGVQMVGGISAIPGIVRRDGKECKGFLFNETGWYDNVLMIAAIRGDKVDAMTSYATGVYDIGDEVEVTDTFENVILSVDGSDAAEGYRDGIGYELVKNTDLSLIFPIVYAHIRDIPFMLGYSTDRCIGEMYSKDSPLYKGEYAAHPEIDENQKMEMINANHKVQVGKKIKRAFIYDKKAVDDNRALFRRVEGFEKAETIFGYFCSLRAKMYPNISKWELSVYENSNLCGCVTEGEITCSNGRNSFANCSFVLSVLGEKENTQVYNPYAFSHTDSLSIDNQPLVNYLMTIAESEDYSDNPEAAEKLNKFIADYEVKLFSSETEGIPNEAAMNMDIESKGFDRICMIDITDSSGMKSVFSKQLIDMAYKNYISVCKSFSKSKKYKLYILNGWHIAIGTPSYKTALSKFEVDMKMLQKKLFESSREYIAIVPLFCLIDGCKLDNVDLAYYSSRAEMMKKNMQFYVSSPDSKQLDEDEIREKYHMVNVVNYAISHDTVIPYYQGILDNKSKKIHHYESLMRLQDESGRVYYPGEFLDIARKFGLLYDSLSLIMIKKVFERFKNAKESSVSINMGIRDIQNPDIVKYIYSFLGTVQKPQNFIFEILENEDISDYDSLMEFVDRIHELGGKISIDDFGSGYSNLQHLMSIHSDFIKIDGSIIRQCCESSESENLIALIAGWKNISSREVKIVAEYVENDGIQNKMTRYDIDYSQGYLFSKPAADIKIK